jgi:metal-responsive CopG/Arc/MetJ family transcriptional regulator
MRSFKNVSVALPPDMLAAVERVCRSEQRTRSELFREALRRYFSARNVAMPTPREKAAIRRMKRERALGRVERFDIDDVGADRNRQRP